MSDSAKVRLKASAAAYLQSIHCDPGPFRVIVVCHGEEHVVKAAVWPAEVPGGGIVVGATRADELPAGSRWMSPLEKQIVAILAGGVWMSSEKLASCAKYVGDLDRLKAVLTNMADAGVLESATGKGYRLAGCGESS